jgi:hypothetical protein
LEIGISLGFGAWDLWFRASARGFGGTIDERYNNRQTVALISDVDLAVKGNPTASRKNPTDNRLNSSQHRKDF